MPDDGSSLLDVLRDRLSVTSAKDGCSPQGQCGCCTVWVDGSPRVACVTPVRRLDGRNVTTLEGLDPGVRQAWSEALTATGGSQCGFCTPGIVMRLAASGAGGTGGAGGRGVDDRNAGGSPVRAAAGPSGVRQALAAHLCRCTGWQTIDEAAALVADPPAGQAPGPVRSWGDAARRATLEGGSPQQVGAGVTLGRAGFADDTAPPDALVAVPDADGGYVVADTLRGARVQAGKVQGRRTTVPPGHPVPMPPGDWLLRLRTAWVEPGYLEPDASWCEPGGDPVSPVANGGAFGGKRGSPVGEVARRLAAEHGRPVRVLWSREDVVRWGPKRPPVAVGMAADGTGVLRVGVSGAPWDPERLRGVAEQVATAAPGLTVEQYPVVGPSVSTDLRAALWAEAAVVEACRRAVVPGCGRPDGDDLGRGPRWDVPVEVVSPSGGRAVARCRPDGSVAVTVWAGEVLDRVVLRSYAIGAVHQALGWVASEGIAVGDDGQVADLTVRSFGIVPARSMPPVEVTVEDGRGSPPVNGSDAVFAAVAAARWLADGLVGTWPTGSLVGGGATPASSSGASTGTTAADDEGSTNVRRAP